MEGQRDRARLAGNGDSRCLRVPQPRGTRHLHSDPHASTSFIKLQAPSVHAPLTCLPCHGGTAAVVYLKPTWSQFAPRQAQGGGETLQRQTPLMPVVPCIQPHASTASGLVSASTLTSCTPLQHRAPSSRARARTQTARSHESALLLSSRYETFQANPNCEAG